MATEEVNKPPSLPPYSEMILAAIDSLNEKDGSNKSAIAKYIESTYGDLPESHTTLLTDSLNQMKDNGELILAKNNYMRPNPNAPPKRGRGRPPKPKTTASSIETPTPATDPTAPPRSRGRPPKQRDPLSVTAAPLKVTTSGTGRGRGRPPKKDSGADKETETTTTVPMTGLPRPRGRPPKVKPQFAAVGCD
ncbi:Hmg-y-related protein a [Thalictrum thalictroides]|uniref:HMG-Y-related protein A n=1 Tax=Thalictrum thalictroides TaxID=46969 RepID=A0A7J6VF39_THATH|nr:Hmg-y-related protein a [Thalictrum thalictroides]